MHLIVCRERVWRQWIEDELHNRDHPLARPRTQRRLMGGGEGEEKQASGIRQPRPLLNDGGMDKAYLREYIVADSKRQRRE